MGIGAGIFLIAIGAVLAFAVHVTTTGVDLQTVGVILIVVGAIGIALDLAIFMPRRRRTTTTYSERAYVDPVYVDPARPVRTVRPVRTDDY